LTQRDTSRKESFGSVIDYSGLTLTATYYIKISRPNQGTTLYGLALINSIYNLNCTSCYNSGCEMVCNTSLENSSANPTGFSQINNIYCWGNTAGTEIGSADQFNSNGTGGMDVPNNSFGIEAAHTGNAYAGIITHQAAINSPNCPTYREYLCGRLAAPLVAGYNYRISFWVSLADNSGWATGKIGAYLSSNVPVQNCYGPMFNYTPQVFEPNVITQDNGWSQITGNFVANGGEQYITIGVFVQNSNMPFLPHTPAVVNPNLNQYAYYYIDDVSVQQEPNITVTQYPLGACANAPVTFSVGSTGGTITASTWNSNQGTLTCLNPPSCSQVSFPNTFTSTTTYTVTSTIFAGCTTSNVFSFTPSNSGPNVSAGPDQTICLGGMAQLNGNIIGGYTNSNWSILNSSVVCSSCQTATVAPTATTNYVFTVTNSITGCTSKDTVTITVTPLTPTIVSPPGATTCSGCFNFTTASNYTSYFWSTNAVNSSGGNTSTLNACWGAPYDTSGLTGNVSVSVVDANGCQGSAYIFVPSCCPFKVGQFNSYPNLINDSTSRVDNFTYPTLYNYNTANGYYEATNQQFSINGVYVVDRDTRFIGCEVKLGPNAKIIIRPGKKFELTNFGTTPTKLYACSDMWDGIYVDGLNAATKVTILNGTVIEDAKNAIVSTNGGNFFLDGGATFNKLNKNNIGVLIKSYSGTHPGVIRKTIFSCDAPGQQGSTNGVTSLGPNCRAPISGTSLAGVYIENCTNVTVGDSALASYRNLFERTKFGVYSFKSNVKVWNNDFKYFSTTSVGKNVPANGVAVYASSAKFYPRGLTVGKPGNYKAKNKFTKCSYGTFAVTWMSLTCEYNRYDSCTVQGITAMNTAGQSVTINADTLTECTGTNIQCTQVAGSNVNITRNLINQLSNFNLSNFGHTGILVSNAVLSYTNLKIQYNTVKKMKNGIWVSRVKNAKITDNSQINFMAGQPMSQSNPCIGIKLEEVNNSLIRMNGVGFPNAPTLAVHDEIFGVHMTNCVNDTVTKNTFSRMGSAIFLKGTCNPCILGCNTMTTCWFGVNFNYLNTYGTGVSINDQITWTAANTPYSTGNAWTACTNDVTGRIQPVNSNGIRWYYNGYNPNTSTMFPGSLFNNATTFSSNGNLCSQILVPPTQTPEAIRNYTIGGICKNPRNYDTLNSAYQYHDQVYAYRMLLENPSWKSLGTADDSYYVNFYNTHSAGNIGKFAEVEDKIALGAVTEASATLSTITPSGQYEINRKALLEVYLGSWANDSLNLSSSQELILLDMVYQSTLDGGTSVFDARNMLHLEVHDSTRANSAFIAEPSPATNTINPIYPNPTTGQLSLDLKLDAGETGTFELYDLSGRLAASWQMLGGQSKYSFDATSLPAGTYIYRVSVNKAVLRSDRLIIIKE
jgi:hypothetical protein